MNGEIFAATPLPSTLVCRGMQRCLLHHPQLQRTGARLCLFSRVRPGCALQWWERQLSVLVPKISRRENRLMPILAEIHPASAYGITIEPTSALTVVRVSAYGGGCSQTAARYGKPPAPLPMRPRRISLHGVVAYRLPARREPRE